MRNSITNKTDKVINSEVWQNVIQQAITSFATSVIEEEVDKLKAELGAYRWGSQDGYIRAIGSRISIDKPRMRKDKKEIHLESYKKLQGKETWASQLTDTVLGGLSQRHFDKVGNILGSHYGLSKSQVSRAVSVGLKRDFDVLMNNRCDDIVAIMIDGKQFGRKPKSHCILAVLGINQFGAKRIIGLASGTTETTAVVGDLLSNLIDRGLKEPQLTVIDGSKALKVAVQKYWVDALIARCQVHKKRNLSNYLDPMQSQLALKKYDDVVNAPNYHEGYLMAISLHKELAKYNQSAAASFKEGLEELLVPLLIQDKKLRNFFSSTNPIESFNSTIEGKTSRVRNWRNPNQILYWVATAHRQQQKNFNKIKGHKSIGELAKLKEVLAWEKKLLNSKERQVA